MMPARVRRILRPVTRQGRGNSIKSQNVTVEKALINVAPPKVSPSPWLVMIFEAVFAYSSCDCRLGIVKWRRVGLVLGRRTWTARRLTALDSKPPIGCVSCNAT